MSGTEGFPDDYIGEPWHDRMPEHIERLIHLMRGTDDDGGIPAFPPDSLSTDAPDDFRRLSQTRQVPELEKYLTEGFTPAHRVVTLADIPRLIGGVKSGSFVVNNGEDRSDTDPNEGLTLDLRRTAIDAQGMGSFVDFFEQTERQADSQYADALFAAQQVVADARERSMDISVLLIPETVNMSASDYFIRLQRLAQDLGIPVAINTEDHEDGFEHEEFRHFYPPAGESPEAYWEGRTREAREPERTRITQSSSAEDIEAALDQFWETRGEDEYEFRRILGTLAAATPEALDEALHENHRYVLKEMAHFSEVNRGFGYEYARVIMAKLGDMPVFERLLHEVKDHVWQWDIHRVAVPLGLYARRDPNVSDLLIDMTEFAAKNRDDTTAGVPLNQLLGALFHSFSPRVGPYLAKYLNTQQPDGHEPTQAHSARSATTEWMPKYVDVISSLPESEERATALEAIKAAALEMLDQEINPHDKKQYLAQLRRTAGDILVRMGVDDQKDRMSKHMLWLYEHQGSLVSDQYFEEQYVQYRKLYGDIPEISQHIAIV